MKKYLLPFLSFLSFAASIFVMFYIKYLPSAYVILYASLIFLMTVFSYYIKKKWFRIVVTIIPLLISSLLIYVQYSSDHVFTPTTIEKNVVSFIVLKNSSINTIVDTKDAKFANSATMDSDLVIYLKSEVKKQNANYSWGEISDDLFGIDELMASRIDVLVIDNAVLETIIAEKPAFQTNIKIIWSLEKSIEKVDITKDVDVAHKPFIVLISGIDIAGSISLRSRSDVNILVVVNPLTRKIKTISIPRDTYVKLGCKSKQLDKLTHAGIYGINCTVGAIEDLLDIDINYYVRVNFSSVLNIINIIGRIDVYSKFTFRSGGRNFVSGMNSMNAEEALRFSRERHAFANGDIQRGLNQQELVKGIIKKLTKPETLFKINSIVKAVRKSIDTNISSTDINIIIRNQIDNNQAWSFSSDYLNGHIDMQPTYSMGSRLLYVWIPDELALTQLHNEIITFKSETASGY